MHATWLLVLVSAPCSLAAAVLAISLPSLVELTSTDAVTASVRFEAGFSHWLVPQHVMLGRYPGSDPKRPISEDAQRKRLSRLRKSAGISTFVGLQLELLPQDTGRDPPVPAGSDLQFRSYYRDAGGADAKFVHFPIKDMSTAPTLEALDRLVVDLAQRVESGEILYIHCHGGAGRTGLVAACLLGELYPSLTASEALERVQAYFTARGTAGRSPETAEQARQVRAWFQRWRKPRLKQRARAQ